jgi:hypothetical protein
MRAARRAGGAGLCENPGHLECEREAVAAQIHSVYSAAKVGMSVL